MLNLGKNTIVKRMFNMYRYKYNIIIEKYHETLWYLTKMTNI